MRKCNQKIIKITKIILIMIQSGGVKREGLECSINLNLQFQFKSMKIIVKKSKKNISQKESKIYRNGCFYFLFFIFFIYFLNQKI